ncbi:MAG: hypothetical protein LQ342_002825 [Letrouitia transgressa]|nr:MAG: hypothetical protein LQ342_002825 [Letrouitia transgressa]
MADITLKQQSLSVSAPSRHEQFQRHVSLLSSHSETVRKNSLGYLTSAFSTWPVDECKKPTITYFFPKLLPLIVDASNDVRRQLLRLFQVLPAEEIKGKIEMIETMQPWIRSGLCHLAASINDSALDVLLWVLNTSSDDFVSCSGGWVKVLDAFIAMLGWSLQDESSGWTNIKTMRLEPKLFTKALNVLKRFLRAGLEHRPKVPKPSEWGFPLWHTQYFMLPSGSNPYRHLRLFDPEPLNEKNHPYGSREERQRIYHKLFRAAVDKGLEATKREGGEPGRVAASTLEDLANWMKDFQEPITPRQPRPTRWR